jgi:hypothetical protein
MDIGGCRKGTSLSEEAQCRGSLGRAALLETQKIRQGSFFLEPEDIKNVSLGSHLELW